MRLKNWLLSCIDQLTRGNQATRNGSRFSPRRSRVQLSCEPLESRLAPATLTLLDPTSTGYEIFGDSVALSGGNVLVGAEGSSGYALQGAAFLYNLSGQLLQTLHDPSNPTDDSFGSSVALSGADVLVGASGANGGAGAVFLFNTSGQLLQSFQDPGNSAEDSFGYSVALSDNSILVGAVGVNGGAGAAYLYSSSGQLLQTFQDPNSSASDAFGNAVALSDGNVLVGESQAKVGAGAAFLFSTSGPLLRTFADPNSKAKDSFGYQVALSDSEVLVGADGVNMGQGAAYLYSLSGQLLQTFLDPANSEQDSFGSSVAASDSYLLVGAFGVDGLAGAAYLYSPSGKLLQTFQDAGGTTFDTFGDSVALSGENILVGASGVNGGAGAAYLYGSSGPLLQSILNPNNTGNDSFGDSVGLSGGNMIVGADGVNGGVGAAYLYDPSGQQLRTLQDPDNTAGDSFGNSVALLDSNALVAADGVNGGAGAAYYYNLSGQLLQIFADPNSSANDSFGDSVALSNSNVLVGAEGVNGGEGAAYLYSPSGTLQQTFVDPNSTADDSFGDSVALSSTNVLVGADGVNEGAGAAYLYSSSGSLLETFADPNAEAGDLFGSSVSMSDSNVLIGAPGVNGAAGAAYLFDSSGQLLQTYQDPGSSAGDNFGVSVALSSSDALVGANGVNAEAGAVYLFSLSGPLLQTFADPSGTAADYYGSSIALSSTNLLAGAVGVNGGAGAAYLNPTIPTLTFTQQPSDAVPNQIINPAVTLEIDNPNGQLDTSFNGTVTIAIGNNPSNGTLSGTLQVTAQNGVASFDDLSIDTFGPDYTLTASSDGLDSVASNPFNVQYPLVVTSQPPSAVPTGGVFSLVVKDEDGFGHVNPTFNGSVTLALASNPGVGTLGGTLSVMAVNGVADFTDLTLDRLGTGYTIQATSDGQTAATTTAFNVTASQLVVGVQPPNSVTAGAGFGLVVKAEDSSGDVDPTFNGDVTLMLANNPGGSTLGGALTGTAVDGILRFSGLTLNKIGTGYTLQATSSGLTAATTNGFAVTPAAATQLVMISQPPANVTVAAGIGFVIAAEDPFDNVDANFNGKVAVALANNPSHGKLGGTLSMTAVNGIAIFNGLTLNKLGTGYTLLGTSTPLSSVTTSGINVVAIADKGRVLHGSGQSVTVGATFSTLLQAVVTNLTGKPVANVPVTFSLLPVGAGAMFQGTSGSFLETENTNAFGVATATALTANTRAGSYLVSVAIQGVVIPAVFSETNKPSVPASIAVTSGSNQTATVGTAFAHPFQVIVKDLYGNPVPGASVTFTAPTTGANGKFTVTQSPAQISVKTNAAGLATAPGFAAGKVAGSYSLTAAISGFMTSFSETNAAGAPAVVTLQGGSGQSATVATPFANALQVVVTDRFGNLLANVPVTFKLPAKGPGGTFSLTGTVKTDASGVATAPTLFANTTAGSFSVTAIVAKVSTPVVFRETNTPAAAATITVTGGANQTAKLGTAFAKLFQVVVKDAFGNVVPNAAVTFTAPATGASGTFSVKGSPAQVTVMTGATGLATAPTFLTNRTAGKYSVIASVAGVTTTAILAETNAS